MICPVCEANNDADALECGTCGKVLLVEGEDDEYQPPLDGLESTVLDPLEYLEFTALEDAVAIDVFPFGGDHAHVAPGVHTGGEVTIGAGSLVGMGAIIMPGRKLGANSVVGAAALVQRDVEDATVVVGVPARPVRRRVPLSTQSA